MKVKVFILEIYDEGKRTIWPEALPAKAAFMAAKTLAKDGFRPVLIRMDLSREQYMMLCQHRILFNRQAS